MSKKLLFVLFCFMTFACQETNNQIKSESEKCDGIDNDKDGWVDEDFDLDGDGFIACEYLAFTNDCDDTNHLNQPLALEKCDDGIDNDCDEKVDANDDDCNSSCGVLSLCEKQQGVCAGMGEKCIGDEKKCDYQRNPKYQDAEFACNDGVDNDCDGKADTADTDCQQFGACSANQSAPVCKRPDAAQGQGICAGVLMSCMNGYFNCDFGSINGFEFNENTVDQVDNDCDGQVDEESKTFSVDDGLMICKCIGRQEGYGEVKWESEFPVGSCANNYCSPSKCEANFLSENPTTSDATSCPEGWTCDDGCGYALQCKDGFECWCDSNTRHCFRNPQGITCVENPETNNVRESLTFSNECEDGDTSNLNNWDHYVNCTDGRDTYDNPNPTSNVPLLRLSKINCPHGAYACQRDSQVYYQCAKGNGNDCTLDVECVSPRKCLDLPTDGQNNKVCSSDIIETNACSENQHQNCQTVTDQGKFICPTEDVGGLTQNTIYTCSETTNGCLQWQLVSACGAAKQCSAIGIQNQPITCELNETSSSPTTCTGGEDGSILTTTTDQNCTTGTEKCSTSGDRLICVKYCLDNGTAIERWATHSCTSGMSCKEFSGPAPDYKKTTSCETNSTTTDPNCFCVSSSAGHSGEHVSCGHCGYSVGYACVNSAWRSGFAECTGDASKTYTTSSSSSGSSSSGSSNGTCMCGGTSPGRWRCLNTIDVQQCVCDPAHLSQVAANLGSEKCDANTCSGQNHATKADACKE